MSADLPINIRRGMNYVVTTHYFYASILLKRPIQQTTRIPTACMDVRGQISINLRFVEPLTIQQCVFLLCHECWHYMLSHCLRRGKRDPKKWNWACDAWINETLISMNVGEFIPGGIRYPGAEKMSVDALYYLAPDDLGEGESGGSLGDDIDDSGVDEMSPAEKTAAEGTAKVEIIQAARAAQQMGTLDAALKGLIDALIHVKTPWYRILEQFMTKSLESDYSWFTPDPDWLPLGKYLPGLDGVGCGKLAIVLDESASIDQKLVNYFGGHVNTMLTACSPEKVYVLHTATRVRDVDEYEPDQFPVTLERKATGGTDMSKGVEYVLKHYSDVDAIIVLTDGETPFGKACRIPVLWAITVKDIQSPHGQTVYVDPND